MVEQTDLENTKAKTTRKRATRKVLRANDSYDQIRDEVGDYLNVLHADYSDASKSSKNLKPGSNKWNQERRLEFIEYRLCWNNQINRSDLVNFFGISIPQASLDISRYIEMAPANLTYDRRAKVYLKTVKFKPVYPEICNANAYLNDALMHSTGHINPNFAFLDKYPSIATFTPPARVINFDILSNIVYCIQNRRAIKIVYQSMNTQESTTRVITPHALAYDGIRWHVRAYCSLRNEFRDFVLSRIQSTGRIEAAKIDVNEDMKWNFVVSLHIAANPELPEFQRKAIEIDYGMTNGEVVFKCRQALLLYVLRTLRLSEEDERYYKFQTEQYNNDPDNNPKPQIPQIVLKNKNEIYLLQKM